MKTTQQVDRNSACINNKWGSKWDEISDIDIKYKRKAVKSLISVTNKEESEKYKYKTERNTDTSIESSNYINFFDTEVILWMSINTIDEADWFYDSRQSFCLGLRRNRNSGELILSSIDDIFKLFIHVDLMIDSIWFDAELVLLYFLVMEVTVINCDLNPLQV